MGTPADCERNRGEGPSAAPRAAPLWGRGASRGRGVRLEVPCAVRAWRAFSACLICPEPVHPLDTRGIDVVFSSGCRRVSKTLIEGEEGVSMVVWAPPTLS